MLLVLPQVTGVTAQVLHGTITDSSGEPLAYASVYISELRMGTTSNQEGLYEITLPSGTYSITFQFLGYVPVSESVTIISSDIQKDITLNVQYYEIPAVRISASGKDPAYYIMRKAIGMAPYHLNQVKHYKAEVYIKGGGRIDKLPKIIERKMRVETNDEQIKEGEYYFTESVNVITFNAPDKYLQQVISSQSNIPVNDEQASPMDYLQASFYQPVIVDMTISPLAPNAFSHYNFEFMGSTSQGDFVIDKVKVTPKRRSQQLFEGVIYIVEDLWAIHSLDLTNENIAGKVRVKQLYTPVEEGIWMPVSHEFIMDLSFIGIRARASYTSAVRYLEVEPDRSLPAPAGYGIPSVKPSLTEKVPDNQKNIEEIFAKEELTARDMKRLAKLNKGNASYANDRDSLEIRENTTYIIEKDALNKDSTYWEETRPIPLSEEEVISLSVNRPVARHLAHRDSTNLTISAGGGSKGKEISPLGKAVKAVLSGKRWYPSKNTTVGFDGLIDLRTVSFNTVDGFVAGTGMTLMTKTGNRGRLTVVPSAQYAFSRKRPMWSFTVNMLCNPMTSGTFFMRAGSYSREFSSSGVNPFINTVSSLLFRENLMKLYNSTYFIAGHRGDLANGLNLNLTAMWERRGTLENTTSFSIMRPDNDYSVNMPVNPFVMGEVHGYKTFIPVNHNHASIKAEITYTPRQHYRISNGAKISAGSDYPTFSFQWKHGFNYNDTLAGHYDMLEAEISHTRQYGALNEFSWRLRGGGFLNSANLQLQDMHFANTQASPVLLNSFEDAFYLKEYYSIASPSCFAEAFARFTTPYLLLKRLPGLSRTLIRENIGMAALWTPDNGFYTEIGYTCSEIFLLAEFGVYAGFRNLSYDGIGLRLKFNIR